MKKFKSIIALALLGVTLTSCGGQNNSSSTSSTTSSSTSSVDSDVAVFESYLAKLKQNYLFEASVLLKSGSSVSKYLNDVSISDGVYNSISYEPVASTGDVPTKDIAYDKVYYTKNKLGYACNTYLGLDNQIKNKVLTSASTGKPLSWDNTSFTNPFAKLTINDFTKTVSGFKLRTVSSDQLEALSAVGVNLSGGLSVEAKACTFSVENDVISCNVTYEAATTSSGANVDVSVSGKFTKFGDNLTSLPTVLTETDATLEAAIKSLQACNFEFVSTRQASITFSETESQSAKYEYDGKTDSKDFILYSYSVDDSGKALMSTSAMQTTTSGVIQLTKVKDNFYQDGTETTGVTLKEDFFPEYSLSSALFKKDTSKSTSTKSVYVFRDDIFPVQEYSKNYSPIETAFSFDGFTITLDNSDSKNPTISFTNTYETYYQYSASYAFPMTIVDEITYSNINKVSTGSVINLPVKNNCDELKWSDSWEDSCGYYNSTQTGVATPEEVFGEGMTAEVLDTYVPTLGGVYPSYGVNRAQDSTTEEYTYYLTYSTSSTTELRNMVTSINNKFVEAGYTYDTTTGIYSKNVTINGVSKTISIECTVLQSSSYYYLAISPSIANTTSSSTGE